MDQPPISVKTYELSNGYIGIISKVYKQSSIEAIKRGIEIIT
ncbi:MAG: hypothetical protein ACFFAO_18730 [Candidatus Hermodarchaeota archaeon]